MGVLVFAIIEGPDLGWWEPQILIQYLWLDLVRKRGHLTGSGGARDFGRGIRAVYPVGKAPRAGSPLGAVASWIVFLFHVFVGQFHRWRGSYR